MGNTCSSSCFQSANCLKAPEIPEEFIASVLGIRRFNYTELRKATGNFDSLYKIGADFSGTTYKGVLGDGTLAAIKVPSDRSNIHMSNEISALANIEHQNLVKLLGFYVEGEHIILVFRYLKNGKLSDTLFSKEPHVIDWTWPMRRRICIGVAKGLRFLHDAEIVHRDIKPSNILLDDDFVPKISEFGLAKRFDSHVSHMTTRVVGTIGYVAPEYLRTGRVTKKVDVYSFGILLLEIVTKRKQISYPLPEEFTTLSALISELHEKGELVTLFDGSMDTSLDVEEACRYLKIGLLCLQLDFMLRPSISTVLEMLRGKCEINTDNISRPTGDPFVSDVTPLDSASEISGPLNDPGNEGLLSPGNAIRSVLPDSTTSLSTSFTYEEVKKITTNFSQKISSTDGDASMYVGFITKELRQQLGPLQVTVKIFDGAKCYEGNRNEFQAQLDLLKKISHPNLVKILGHCFKRKQLILIHEMMAHGSLADHLYSGEWSSLSWLVRVKIAFDAARGLAYLHESERSIIHGDFKPSNILMDTDYNAKVFSFGPEVAGPKEFSSEGSDTSLGTFGYAASAYSGGGRVSMKSDVYSFGVVLVELLSGRRWTAKELVDWAQFFSRENNVLRNIDARLKGKYPIKAAEDVFMLACKCLDDNPERRPSMGDIVDSLKMLLEDDFSTTKEDVSIAFEGSPLSLPSVSTKLQNQLEITNDSTIEPIKKIPLLDLEIQPQDQGTSLMLMGLGLTEAPKPEEWLNAREIYLMNNLLDNLPQSPRCPLLSVLLLQGNHKLRKIPTTFFESMPLLQVLNLSQTHIKSLPDSLFELHNLKSLSLRDCGLFTVLSSKIGQLHQLEVLDLESTEIADLPKEIQNLTNLKCLKLSFYGDFSPESKQSKPKVLIPQGTISALSQLGELSIDVNPEDERWEEEAEAIFKDVCGLTGLHTLKLYFPTVTYLSYFKRPLPLCFRITVGPHSNRIMSRLPQDLETELEQWVKCVRFINGDDHDDGHVDIQRILGQSTAFFLDRHKTSTKLSSFGLQNMQQLRHCIVGECNAMEYLIDGMSDFRSLESLHVYHMKNLRGMCSTGPVHTPCLGNLRSLTLQTCPNVIVVFTPELLKNLINLEELRVEDCEVATSLVMCQDKSEYEGYCFLPKLKTLSLHYLPELSSIADGLVIGPELEWLSVFDCPNLRSLKEVGSRHLTRIEGESSWWEGVHWSDVAWFEDVFCSIDIVE